MMEAKTKKQTPPVSSKTRKRKAGLSTSPDDSGDESKKRGRPRVSKQDESAADRRRTQIRMAQRAYRRRKESTLEELRKRVSELANTAELMNRAFLDCKDWLEAAGLPEREFQRVRETATRYETLMKCVRNSEDMPPVDLPLDLLRESTDSSTGAQYEPQNVSSWIDRATLTHTREESDLGQIGLGYTLFMPETNDLAVEPNYFHIDHTSEGLDQTPNPNPQQLNSLRIEIPELRNTASLTPPRTYSFQESTFARRLHRAALERGYQLLLAPDKRPSSYHRVFHLSLMNRDPEKLARVIKAALDRGPHKTLDSDAALIHVGGAGTHYARRDPYGNLIPKKQPCHVGMVGPHTLALLEHAARDNIGVDMTVDIAGFEGEWLDPDDVEGYLAEKGIFIDPSTSFVEAELHGLGVPLSEPDTSDSASTPTGASPLTPGTWSIGLPITTRAPTQELGFDPEQTHALLEAGIGPADYNGLTTRMTGVGFSDARTGSWENFLQPGCIVKNYMDADEPIHAGSPMSRLESTACTTLEAVGITSSSLGTEESPNKIVLIDVDKFVKSEQQSPLVRPVRRLLTGCLVPGSFDGLRCVS
jgi:hypothetical protein